MSDTITAATVALGELLSTLEGVFARAASAKALINFLGWELPPGLDHIGLAGIDFTNALEKLRVVTESSAADLDDEILLASRVADLGFALANLVGDIRHLAATLPQRLAGHDDYVARTNIHKELPRRIFDLVIAGYLVDRSSLAFSLLNLLNIVEFKHFPADASQFQVEHVRAIVHYEHFRPLFADPPAYMRASYGWGTPNFAVADLITRIGQVLRAIGASIRLQTLDLRAEQALLGGALPDADQDPMPQLNIYLFEEIGIAGQRVGFSAFGVRSSSAVASDGGIGFLPIVHGEATGEIPLHAFDDTFLEFSAEADLLRRIALILRPDQPAQLQRASTLSDLPGGQLALGIRHGRRDAETKPLLTFPGGSALSVQQVALKGGITRLAGSSGDSFLELDLTDFRVSFSLSEADPFLSNTIHKDRIETSFDIQLEWSASQGIRLHGSGGLQVSLPVHLPVGPLLVRSIYLALDIKDDRLGGEVSISGVMKLGPLTASVDRLGLIVNASFIDGNLGLFDLTPHFKPPDGVGLSINEAVVTGGGFLHFDEDKGQYAGVVQLNLQGGIAVTGIGLIATRLPDGSKGFSLLIIITAEDLDIQLGFGFRLTAIGGLLAINRTFDEEALRAGLKNRTLDSVLFPKDPISNAPQLLSNLNKVFPPAPGHHLFGPVARIEWGAPALITADLALVLELGTRHRLLLLAQIAVILPKPDNDLIRLQLDAIGVFDFDEGSVALDAVLYDSRLLKKFVLTGGMAMRLNVGSSPNFALAIGGLHPAFNPPPNFPKLERIAINLTAGDNPRFRCEAYFALTANTVQFGARAELFAKKGGFSIQGEVGFDVLIQFSPFQFLAEFHAQVQVKRGKTNLLKVRVEGALAGPKPLHIKAKATFEVLWWDVSVRIDTTLFEGEKPPLPEPIDVLPLLLEALEHPGNWVSRLPANQNQMVTLRARSEQADQVEANEVLLHPLGVLTVKQGVVPLNMDISRFGQTTPAGARRFVISSVSLDEQEQATGEAVRDFFAPAQFFEMSDAEKLSRPSFDQMAAGVEIGSHEIKFSLEHCLPINAIEFETTIYDRVKNESRPGDPQDKTDPKKNILHTITPERLLQQAGFGAAGASDLRRSGSAKYRTTVGKYEVKKEGWSIVATDDLTVQPAPGAAQGKAMSYSEAEQALEQLQQEDPASAGRLKIMRFQSEVQRLQRG